MAPKETREIRDRGKARLDYKAIIEETPSGFWVSDLDGRILDVNAAYIRMSGYTRDELLQRKVSDLEVTESPEQVLLHIGIVCNKGWDQFESRHRRKDGTVFDVSVAANYLGNDSGLIVAFVQEVTERKRAQESEERLRALMDHNPSLIFMKDERGGYVYLNGAYEREFALTKDWYGKTDFDFWPRKSAELFRANDTEVIESGRTRQFLEDSLDREGKRHCWLCYKFPFTDSTGRTFLGGIGIDATDRVRADESLREARERAEAILSNITDAFFAVDREWRFVYVNPAAESALRRSATELLGRNIWETFPRAEGFRKYYEQAAYSGEAARFEKYYPPLEAWFEVQAYPGPEGLSVYFRDVSDRRRRDDELRDSRERLAAATEAAGVGIHDFDPVSGTINWDPRVRELWGVGPAEPITYDVFISGVHPEDRTRVQTAVDSALDPGGDGKFFSEYRVIDRSNGIERWIAATGRVTFEGSRAVRLVGTVQDVTARKLARENHEATQNLLRSVSETVADTVYVKDTDSRILFANPATLSVIGRTEAQVLGKTDREFYDDPEIGEAILANDRRIMESGVAEVIEETIQTPQGYRTFLSTKAPRRDASGRIIGLVGVSRDITERKKAEAELRERERLLAVSQAVAHVGNWQWDSVHDRITWSDEMYRIYGVDRASFKTEISAVNALIHPDDLALQEEAIRNLLAGRPVEAFEYRVKRPDGTERVVRVLDAQPNFEGPGNVVGVSGVVVDVTESRLAEAALRQSEQMFRSYFELGLIGMAITSPAKGFLEINDETCRILGYDRAELLNKSWAEITQPEDLPADAEQFERMLAGKLDAYTIEKRFIRKNGEIVFTVISVRAMRRPDGSSDYLVGLMQDVTERKKAEETQRKSEARMRAIISTLPVGVAVMDEAGRVVVTNQALDRIWGDSKQTPEYPSDLQDTGRFKGWWANSGIPLAAEDWASSRALIKGETSVGEVIDIECFDGTRRTILNSATPLRDVNGNVDGAVVAVMDITELTQAQKALKEADRRKDEFLAMLAHELRNPLAAISSANELLQQVGSQDLMVRRARDAAARQTDHMARLLDDLLDVARVTQRKVTLNKTDVSLLSVLESAVEASNPAVNKRKHRLYVSHPREPMRLHADPVRLAQAIGNLVDNAAKYTPPGGEVYLAVDRDGKEAVISVRDNGKGIEPELLPYIFELFVQGSRSPDRAEGGLGIGLTLVRSIVEMHGGRVEARSEGPGRGSEFRIRLPLLCAAEEHATEKNPEGKEESRRLRILVVDDNADSAELLAALLQIQGHEVMTADSGPTAIDLALAQLPEVVLMDIGMPGMDGFEVARRFRSSQQLNHIALVAVSGYGQQEDIEKSREAGFDDHLVKPVDMETVGRVLKKISER